MKVENKKELPFSVTKDGLVRMYINQMPEREIRKSINLIIDDFRKIENNKVKRISHRELTEFVETYGLPKGYQKSNL